MPNSVNRGAGAVIIKRMELVSCVGEVFDISDKFLTMNIYEDLFSPAMHGNVVVIDAQNAFDVLPIVGEETIRVFFHSASYGDPDPNNYIEKEFDVYKVSDVVHESDFVKRYTLHFISPEGKRNNLIRISKGYENARISEIVKTIATDNYENLEEPVTGLGFSKTENPNPRQTQWISPLISQDDIESTLLEKSEYSHREFFIEKTKYTEPAITLPYMRPFDAFQFLSSRAIRNAAGRFVNPNNESANFVFFENKRGYNFMSIDTLLEKKDKNINSVISYGAIVQNLTRDNITNAAMTLDIYSMFDTIKAASDGLYASRMLSYDLRTGEINEIAYDYLEKFDKTESANSGTAERVRPLMKVDGSMKNPNSKRSDAYRILVTNGGYSRDIDTITSQASERLNPSKIEVGTEEYVQKRLSQMARLNTFKIVTSIPGNSKHKVGDMIYLNYRKYDGNEATVKFSKYYSGWYLITSIRHQVSREDYKMVLEIVKDSVNSKIGGR